MDQVKFVEDSLWKFWSEKFEAIFYDVFPNILNASSFDVSRGIKIFTCSCMTDDKIFIFRRRYRRCSIERYFLKKFAKFTGKLLRVIIFFHKAASLGLQLCWKRDPFKNIIFTEHLRTTAPVFCVWIMQLFLPNVFIY